MKIFNTRSLKDCVPDITGSVATLLKMGDSSYKLSYGITIKLSLRRTLVRSVILAGIFEVARHVP